MAQISDHYGVIGVLVVNESTDRGDIVYLRYDPAARETTKWNESSLAAFNDALAAVAATVKYEWPIQECRFYAIDWQQATTRTNIKIEGRSLTLAAALAICSYHGKFPVGHVLCTGDLSQDGRVLPIDRVGLGKKLRFINEVVSSQFKAFVLPGNKQKLAFESAKLKIHLVETLEQALKEIAPEKALAEGLRPAAAAAKAAAERRQSLMDMARVALSGGDVFEAVRIYDKILEQDSHNAAAWYLKGMALLKSVGSNLDDAAETILSVAAHLNGKPLKNQEPLARQRVSAKVGACFQEAIKIDAGYRSDVSLLVSASWERLTLAHGPKLRESLKAAVAPEDIRNIEQIIANLDEIRVALRQQSKWIGPTSLLERIQGDWDDMRQMAAARLKTLREVESDIKIAMALSRLSKSISGDWARPSTLGLGAGLLVLASCIFLVPMNSGLFLAGAALALTGLAIWAHIQFAAKIGRPADPDVMRLLWMNYGRKRGLEFETIPAADKSLEEWNAKSGNLSKEICVLST